VKPAVKLPRKRRRWRIVVGTLVAAVLLFIGIPRLIRAFNTVSTDDAYVNGYVTFVAPRVSGQVTRVLVDDDNQVALIRARVATWEQGKATLVLAQQEFDRAERLLATKVVSQEEYDERRAALDVAKAQVAQALENVYQARVALGLPAQPPAGTSLGDVPADVDETFSSVRQAQAAEIDGVITRRDVNPGDNLQAGQSVMATRSLRDIWIDANFKETQLRKLRIGQHVDLELDMYGAAQKGAHIAAE
jgi:multidrug resistance efflux pump